MNTQSHLALGRLELGKQNRYSPANITDPTQISRKFDSFEVGHIKDTVDIFGALEDRDDLIRAVVSKRKKAVGHQEWDQICDLCTLCGELPTFLLSQIPHSQPQPNH